MRLLCAVLGAGLLLVHTAHAAVVSVGNSTAPWQGFMNVFELPSNGGGFVFNGSWGVPDLTATFNDGASNLTLSPNTVGDPNPFWYTPSGGPGAAGNKVMDANLYVQVDDGSLSGQTVSFQGTVLSNTFTSAHTSVIFIKDFASDFSSSISTTIPVAPGPFSLSLNTLPGAGRHVQYGFETIGVDVWITDTAPFGSAVIATVPAPAALALMSLGGSLMMHRRRR